MRGNPSPFKLKQMTHRDFFDMRRAVESLFLKSPKPALILQAVRNIMVDKNDRHVNTRLSYFGSWSRHVVVIRSFNENISTVDIPRLNQSPPGIQPAKKQDVLKFVQYLENPEHSQYYHTLFANWLPSQNIVGTTEPNIEIDSDDNSDGCED